MPELVESFPIKSFPFLLLALFFIQTRTQVCTYILCFLLKNLDFPQSFFSSDVSLWGPLSFKSLGY